MRIVLLSMQLTMIILLWYTCENVVLWLKKNILPSQCWPMCNRPHMHLIWWIPSGFYKANFLLSNKSRFRWTIGSKGRIGKALCNWKLYCCGGTNAWPTKLISSIKVSGFTATCLLSSKGNRDVQLSLESLTSMALPFFKMTALRWK